jgi:hypothetical protein
MSAPEVILTFVIGVLIRVAIPVALTVLAVWLFRKWDARWQAEAAERARLQMALTAAQRTPCWEQRQCSPQKRASCPAFTETGKLCWQVFRDKDGNLKPACLDCGVFRNAPVSVQV